MHSTQSNEEELLADRSRKRYFIKMYETAVKANDIKMIKFCKDVFDIYDRHKINGHIPRPNGERKT